MEHDYSLLHFDTLPRNACDMTESMFSSFCMFIISLVKNKMHKSERFTTFVYPSDKSCLHDVFSPRQLLILVPSQGIVVLIAYLFLYTMHAGYLAY